jgi:hypothetical protein
MGTRNDFGAVLFVGPKLKTSLQKSAQVRILYSRGMHWGGQSIENKNGICIIFILSFNLLIGWQLSIWKCCKPFYSLLYKCQLLCVWRLALSIVVEINEVTKRCNF